MDTFSLFLWYYREKIIGCNLSLALPFERWNTIPRFALYTVPTLATRNTQTHRFAIPCPGRMFRECSSRMPNCVNGYIGGSRNGCFFEISLVFLDHIWWGIIKGVCWFYSILLSNVKEKSISKSILTFQKWTKKMSKNEKGRNSLGKTWFVTEM